MFKHINSQLEEQAIIIKQGVLVDASIIDPPLKPKGKPTYRVAEDREGDKKATHEVTKKRESKEVEKQVPFRVDADSAWIRKAGTLRYGYKTHHVADEERLVLGVMPLLLM